VLPSRCLCGRPLTWEDVMVSTGQGTQQRRAFILGVCAFKKCKFDITYHNRSE
jgi:hypothetical protein